MTGPEVTQPDPDGGVEMTDGEFAALRGVEVTAAMKAEDVPAEWVEKALLTQVKPGSTIPPAEAGSALNYIRDDLRRALAAVVPEIQAQALRDAADVALLDRWSGWKWIAEAVSAWLRARAARLTATTEEPK